MKRFIIFLLFFNFCNLLSLQAQDSPSWMCIFTGNYEGLNYFKVKKDFYKYWEETKKKEQKFNKNKEHTEENGEEEGIYTQFKRWEKFWQYRINADGSFPKPGYLIEERQKYFSKFKENQFPIHQLSGQQSGQSLTGTNFLANWKEFLTPTANGVGRIDCIAINPKDSNIIWAGSPCGGLWKSLNGGKSWTTNTDTLPILAISEIVIDPKNPAIMYIATGDRDGVSSTQNYSIGVLKSTDSGTTWKQTGLTYKLIDYCTIKRLVIDPSNTDILYVATDKKGVWKTTDAGANWKCIITYTGGGGFEDLALQPHNPSTIYAVKGFTNGVFLYKSTNSGSTFKVITKGLPTSNFLFPKLATTQADSNYLYILVSNPSDYKGLYLSTNAGDSFTIQSDSPNILGYSCSNPSRGDGQGVYNLTICVSPINKKLVFIGGISLWKSTDGGINWTINSCWWQNSNYPDSPHADHHFLLFSPFNSRKIFNGNDGGIFLTNDLGNKWENITNNIKTIMYYNIGTSTTNNNKIILGSQDNGTHIYQNQNSFSKVLDGDGYQCYVDYSNDSIMYGNSNGLTCRTTDNGLNFKGVEPSTGIDGIVIHPTKPNVLFAYHEYLYKSVDRGDNWNKISPKDIKNSEGFELKFSGNDTSVIFMKGYWNIVKINIKTGKKSILSSGITGIISDYTVSPTDTSKIWATIADLSIGYKKVYKTLDGGKTWTDISGSLPNVPMTCIEYEKGSNDGIYIGTDIGVFYRNDTMSDWIPWIDGLPNVIIQDLDIQYQFGKLKAATYGRGVWEGDLYPTKLKAKFVGSKLAVCQSDSVYFTDSSNRPTSWLWKFPGGKPSTSSERNPKVLYDSAGVYDVQLIVSNQAGMDSIKYNNYITVNTSPIAKINASGPTTLCQGDSVILYSSLASKYRWSTGDSTKQITVNKSGDYYVTVTNKNGCSTTSQKTKVNVNSISKSSISKSICSGSFYLFGGQKLSKSGIYTDTISNSVGCDSIITLQLTVNSILVGNIYNSICSGSSYYFGGSYLTKSGTYYDTVSNSKGCDSVIILKLTVNPILTGNVSTSICHGSSYSFGGNLLTQSGTYHDTISSSKGCDSVIILKLTVNPILTGNVSTSICHGSSYSFGGNLLTQSGTYYDTVSNSKGCDSITILKLTVNPILVGNIYDSICLGSPYHFGGSYLTKPGTYYDTVLTSRGCDSVVILNLKLGHVNTDVSIFILTLKAVENGATYQWLDCKDTNLISGATGQSYVATKSGDYAVIINKDFCIDTSECIHVDLAKIKEGINVNEINIFPNPTNGKLNLELSLQIKESMEIKIYDMVGQLVFISNLSEMRRTHQIDMSGKAKGIYFLECVSKQGVTRRRIVLE